VTACNNQQILLNILHVLPSLGKWNLLVNSPKELQYLVVTLTIKVSARTPANLTLFQNLSCNVFLKYLSAHINKMLMLCLLQN
jgi:hypothetical protein